MRTAHGQRAHHTESKFPWMWGVIGASILLIIFISKWFMGGSPAGVGTFFTITPNTESNVVINTTESKKRTVKGTDKLYASDYSALVSEGSATLSGSSAGIFLSKGSEITASGSTESDPLVRLMRGRAWVESSSTLAVELKNMTVSLDGGDVILAEQQTQVYSLISVIKGSVDIRSGDRTYTLPAGKRIMVSQSDLANPATTLESLSDDIGNSLSQIDLFIAHDGASLLSNTGTTETSSGIVVGSGLTLSGMIGSSGSTIQSGKYIEVTSPIDGSVLTTPSVMVGGKILSSDVKKVKINEREAIISQVDQTFLIKDFPLTSPATDLVIKAYDAGGNMLERATISIQSKSTSTTNKLVPTNFGLGDKNFRITSPTENPYRTNTEAMTVSGVVPAGSVSSITVNGYKLTKFVPKSSNWFYYANIKYGTMKEGFNLYEIKFFGADGSLLSSQVFTIIKEGGVVSGER